jgi:hypothetical protein
MPTFFEQRLGHSTAFIFLIDLGCGYAVVYLF